MKITYSEECTLTVQDRYHEIQHFLNTHKIVEVEFKKKSGDVRIIEATRDASIVPTHTIKESVINYETMPVWSVKDAGWKSFKTMNVISIKEKDE